MFLGGATGAPVPKNDDELFFYPRERPLVVRGGELKFEPITPVIYGIWEPGRKYWMVNGDGVIFHTPYLQVAMAELHSCINHLRVPGNWVVVKIGDDGLPDKEAMKELGYD